MYLKSQTYLLVQLNCISQDLNGDLSKKTALRLLSVFKETTAHTPANTAASHCSLPRNQAATAFYKMFVVFNHAPHPCSFNEQN